MTYVDTLPEFRSGNSIPVTRATFTRERMQEVLESYAATRLREPAMSTTILTDDEVDRLRKSTPETVWGYDVNGFGRAIEQAVLQSPEVQAWKRDAERYQATRAAMLNSEDDLPKRMSDYALENFSNPHNPTPDEIDEAYDAAMEKQP